MSFKTPQTIMERKYYIETYGCSLNISDTEYMEGRLAEAGYENCQDINLANVIIINTCTVKDRTFLEFRKRIEYFREFKKEKDREGKLLAVVVAGCIPQANPENPILQPFALIGPDCIEDIADIVDAAITGETPKHLKTDKKDSRLNRFHIRKNPVIEILPISRGCLGSCSFCQTRFARGSLVSYPMEEIITQAKTSLEDGVREIWLTSQDAGAWGMDAGSSLPSLLENLLKISGDYRVRLGMANPDHIISYLEPLLDIFTDERMFRFIHLPLQSGSDDILNKMNRLYTITQYLGICERIYGRYPDFSISTDVIAGFPGETEEDFEKTLEALKKIKPAVVNRSKFSARPKTPASRMPQLPSRIISQRSQRLARLVEELSLENNRQWIGRSCRVLIDDRKKAGSVVSRNNHYKPVVIPLIPGNREVNDCLVPGRFLQVRIEEALTYHLTGKPEITG
ncbi:tRNA (N(6)-L-threonylcarbamoyladenosine(37)-C(2))-methylthiotransferase [Candidatus Sumerlaeota bacterium]|nr:tRNA (N(6)-L-threonylcarbamoyladenosine(37)-C(2))-methylthiotransferase [Candidatus Sumerlaeota bacterium]